MTITIPTTRRYVSIELRSLELLIRRTEAEERGLERRLEHSAEAQRRTRLALESEFRRRHYGKPPEISRAPS